MAHGNNTALPRYYRVLVTLIAVVQWLLVVAAVWLPPEGWSTIFSLPLGRFQLIALGAALLISIYAVLVLIRPGSYVAQMPHRLISQLRAFRGSIFAVPILLIPALPLLDSPEWIGYPLIGMTFALGACLVLLAGETHHEKLISGFAVIAVLTGLALRMWYLFAGYVWNDEGIYLSLAANMLEGGGVSMLMYHIPPEIPIRPGIGYSAGVLGLWSAIFGLGLMQLRALSYIAGIGALFCTYHAAKRWWGQTPARLTAGVVALSFLFMQSTWARNDAIPMLMVGAVLWLHIAISQQKRLSLHVLVGLAVALLIEGHLTNLVYLFSFSAYYGLQYLREAIRLRRPIFADPMWFYIIGFVGGLALYAWLHILILPEPRTYFDAVLTVMSRSGSSSLLDRFINYAARVRNYASFAPFEVLLIVVSMVAAAVRRGKADLHWLQLMLLSELGYLLVATQADPQYSIFGVPVYLTGVGSLFASGIDAERTPQWRTRLIAYGAAVLLLASNLTVLIRLQNPDRVAVEQYTTEIVSYIREHYPPETAIIGNAVWYPYLPEYRNFLIGDTQDAMVAPTIARRDPDDYWMDILLQTWPSVRLQRPKFYYVPAVYESYMAARGEIKINDKLSVVDDTDWVRLEPSADTPLQLIAYSRLPENLRAGDALTVDTLWITRSRLVGSYEGVILLFDAEGHNVDAHTQALKSGWAGSLPASWEAYQFHDVQFQVVLGQDLQGQLEVRLALTHGTKTEDTIKLGTISINTP